MIREKTIFGGDLARSWSLAGERTPVRLGTGLCFWTLSQRPDVLPPTTHPCRFCLTAHLPFWTPLPTTMTRVGDSHCQQHSVASGDEYPSHRTHCVPPVMVSKKNGDGIASREEKARFIHIIAKGPERICLSLRASRGSFYAFILVLGIFLAA